MPEALWGRGVPAILTGHPFPRLALVMVLLGTSGCGSLLNGKYTGQLFDRAGIDVVLSPSDYQEIIIKDAGSKERSCLAPGPDVSVSGSAGLNLGIGAPAAPKETIGADVSRGALGLGGRNPEVLIARELMFRACELSLNLNADEATTLRIYTRFIEAIEKISQYQTAAGTESVAATPASSAFQPPAPALLPPPGAGGPAAIPGSPQPPLPSSMQ
jgi:hypothetical protein